MNELVGLPPVDQAAEVRYVFDEEAALRELGELKVQRKRSMARTGEIFSRALERWPKVPGAGRGIYSAEFKAFVARSGYPLTTIGVYTSVLRNPDSKTARAAFLGGDYRVKVALLRAMRALGEREGADCLFEAVKEKLAELEAKICGGTNGKA